LGNGLTSCSGLKNKEVAQIVDKTLFVLNLGNFSLTHLATLLLIPATYLEEVSAF
jgi:hypothetical protein